MGGLLSDSQSEAVGHMLVLATSNAPWDLDEALRRRLEKRIYIPLPDQTARQRMLQGLAKEIQVSDDVDLVDFAVRTEDYSGADVQLLCSEAAMNPMRRMVEGLTPAELIRLRGEGSCRQAICTWRWQTSRP